MSKKQETVELEVTYTQVGDLKTAFEELPVKGQSLTSASWNIVRLAPYIEQGGVESKKLVKAITGDDLRSIPKTHPFYADVRDGIAELNEKKIRVAGILRLRQEDVKIDPEDPEPKIQKHYAVLLRWGLIEGAEDPVPKSAEDTKSE